MSRSYEMIYILRPDLSEDQVNQEVSKYQEFLTDNNAFDIQIKIWGKRRLAYPIQRFLDGIYVQLNYQGDGTQIAPLERMMRLGEEVLRYLTINLPTTSQDIEEKQEEATEPEPVATEA